MRVNMHVGESYVGESYADQKKQWLNNYSGWTVTVSERSVLPNVRPLGALRPFEPIFKGFTPPLRPYAP